MDEVPLLELRDVEKTYEDGYRAVRGVSYKLGPGQLVGLIGPNGCGKTTMMKCINRMHDPTAGDILIDGESVLDKTPGEIARKVANVPAELRGSFGLTVFETVMLGRYPYLKNVWWEPKEDEDMVTEALEKFGVAHLKDRAVGALSSGERQRVLIAKAYVQQPRLMLVDEPTSHLDMKYKLDVMEYLNAMVKKDMTVLVAEHDISLMGARSSAWAIRRRSSPRSSSRMCTRSAPRLASMTTASCSSCQRGTSADTTHFKNVMRMGSAWSDASVCPSARGSRCAPRCSQRACWTSGPGSVPKATSC